MRASFQGCSIRTDAWRGDHGAGTSLRSCRVVKCLGRIKWLLCSGGMLVKPYDYAPSNFSILISACASSSGQPVNGDPVERESKQPFFLREREREIHLSTPFPGGRSSHSTDVPVKGRECDEHHGWQPAVMMAMMWMANVVGKFLDQVGERVQIDPVTVPLTVIDDPAANLELAARNLQMCCHQRSEACWS